MADIFIYCDESTRVIRSAQHEQKTPPARVKEIILPDTDPRLKDPYLKINFIANVDFTNIEDSGLEAPPEKVTDYKNRYTQILVKEGYTGQDDIIEMLDFAITKYSGLATTQEKLDFVFQLLQACALAETCNLYGRSKRNGQDEGGV